eukprot:Sro19_g013430.1 n/a (805) ;mRNA; r:68848-71262
MPPSVQEQAEIPSLSLGSSEHSESAGDSPDTDNALLPVNEDEERPSYQPEGEESEGEESSQADQKSLWAESVQLSSEAAKAFDSVTSNMDDCDAKNLSLLRDISDSFKILSSGDCLLDIFTEKKKPSLRSPTSQLRFRSEEKVDATPAVHCHDLLTSHVEEEDSPTEQQKPTDIPERRAVELAHAAAKAFNEVNDSMIENDKIYVAELQQLQQCLREISRAPTSALSSSAAETKVGFERQESAEEKTQADASKSTVVSPTLTYLERSSEAQPMVFSTQSVVQTTVPTKASTGEKTRKAKYLSTKAAEALQSMDQSMCKNDAFIHTALNDIKVSFDQMAAAKTAGADESENLTSTEQDAEIDSTSEMLDEKQESSTPQLPVSSAYQLGPQHAQRIAQESADALGKLTASMVGNDASILEELHSLRQSFKTLASDESDMLSCFTPQAEYEREIGRLEPMSSTVPKSNFKSSPPDAQKIELEHSQDSVNTPEVQVSKHPSSPAEQQRMKQAQKLADSTALALNRAKASMVGHDMSTLEELQMLSDQFKELASEKCDFWGLFGDNCNDDGVWKSAVMTHYPEDTDSKNEQKLSSKDKNSADHNQQPLINEQAKEAPNLAFAEQMRIDPSRKESQMLSEASADALNSMSASMMGNDAGTLDELHTLSDSLKRLSSDEYDLYSQDKPAADPPQQLGEAEPISPPQEPPIQAAFVQSRHVEPASTAAFVSGPQESQEPAMDEQEVAATDLAFEEQMRIDQSRKDAQMLSEASANALNSMGASMMGNDAGTLDELHTLSDSFRRLSSADYDL